MAEQMKTIIRNIILAMGILVDQEQKHLPSITSPYSSINYVHMGEVMMPFNNSKATYLKKAVC